MIQNTILYFERRRRLYGVFTFIFGRNHYFYIPMSAPDASGVHPVFCRRGGRGGKSRRTLCNALGFVLGFTLVFVALGAFMAGLGGLLQRYQTVVNLVTGVIVVVFGLNFMGVLNIRILNGTHKAQKEVKQLGFSRQFYLELFFPSAGHPVSEHF